MPPIVNVPSAEIFHQLLSSLLSSLFAFAALIVAGVGVVAIIFEMVSAIDGVWVDCVGNTP
ncbi:hypothetical protein FC91_GL000183 [Schleiferilactobacillus harbinensis DSM 16991]|uniref:Uncharacterized protein n=1 Tax=Schleiferilactobacillus harbinensis DSM 16991 TaxID=1122147 RepID=A0A0R1XG38_9LACO|nr:hypothetical protein FC91_GL000183 [Schleiferilactobacillus harbinensis DSM 16991]